MVSGDLGTNWEILKDPSLFLIFHRPGRLVLVASQAGNQGASAKGYWRPGTQGKGWSGGNGGNPYWCGRECNGRTEGSDVPHQQTWGWPDRLLSVAACRQSGVELMSHWEIEKAFRGRFSINLNAHQFPPIITNELGGRNG